jgi:beta-glucanase (GH16 family)
MDVRAVAVGEKALRTAFRRLSSVVAIALLGAVLIATDARAASNIVGVAIVPTYGNETGYWTVTADGGVSTSGSAAFYGSMYGQKLNKPIVGMAATSSGKGYWLVASDGGIFSFGDAKFFGSTGSMSLNQPIVGMAATPGGYWLVARDGGIFAFGDARFFGSTGSLKLNQPIVGMSATPGYGGYWLVAGDGGIFAYGDAGFFGSTGSIKLNQPIVGVATTMTGKGYWLVASDGGIFAYGDAPFLGSTLASEVRTFGLVPDGSGGYTALRDDGTVVNHPFRSPNGAATAPSDGPDARPVGPPGDWTKVFSDEFDGSALDSSKWITCYPWAPDGCSIGYDEAEWYQRQNVSVGGGALDLTAKKETVTGWGQTWHYTSGMVSSGPDLQRGLPPKFAFEYGYVEARVWVPKGQGLWPAVWMLPAERQWPPELDVFEIIGNDTNTVHMTNHWGTEADHRQSNGHWTSPDDFAAGWHTIGMNWQPDSIRWYVDGVQRRAPFTNAAAIPDMPMYLIMNLAVGGTWPGYPDATTPFPSTFKVDWVRVWQ